jgi:hypothetical protein
VLLYLVSIAQAKAGGETERISAAALALTQNPSEINKSAKGAEQESWRRKASMWRHYPRTLTGILSGLGCVVLNCIINCVFHVNDAGWIFFGMALGTFFMTLLLAMPYELVASPRE